ncbi:hypothetical protein BKA56DRAFT_193464 [Ilyonectria sp. MPI-CAGE-AT-0026]|nr:hypothetical protein BKA56DRAFT_193464 [Ilyonectria sp. MPI-CAGE-AT-0026]
MDEQDPQRQFPPLHHMSGYQESCESSCPSSALLPQVVATLIREPLLAAGDLDPLRAASDLTSQDNWCMGLPFNEHHNSLAQNEATLLHGSQTANFIVPSASGLGQWEAPSIPMSQQTYNTGLLSNAFHPSQQTWGELIPARGSQTTDFIEPPSTTLIPNQWETASNSMSQETYNAVDLSDDYYHRQSANPAGIPLVASDQGPSEVVSIPASQDNWVTGLLPNDYSHEVIPVRGRQTTTFTELSSTTSDTNQWEVAPNSTNQEICNAGFLAHTNYGSWPLRGDVALLPASQPSNPAGMPLAASGPDLSEVFPNSMGHETCNTGGLSDAYHHRRQVRGETPVTKDCRPTNLVGSFPPTPPSAWRSPRRHQLNEISSLGPMLAKTGFTEQSVTWLMDLLPDWILCSHDVRVKTQRALSLELTRPASKCIRCRILKKA